MKKYVYILAVSLLLTSVISQLSAVPAYPYLITVTQPDGTSLTVLLKGDEFHHYHTTADNVLLIKDKKGIFNYAAIDSDGRKVDTKIKARDENSRSATEKQFLKTLNSQASMDNYVNVSRRANAQRIASSGATVARPSKFPRTGNPKSLVILVNFSNLSFVTPEPQKAFENLLNEEGYSANGGTGSAKDYFRDNSMGVFEPNFVVVGPYILPNTYAFYGENTSGGEDKNPVQMIVDACKAASDDGIDFSEYDTDNDGLVDNVFVFYAGFNEAENAPSNTIWPHRWGVYPTTLYGGSGNYKGSVESVTFNGKRVEDYACTSELRGTSGTSMAGIGTFTHEFGHVLGLADMYPTNGASHHTLSSWCIMDTGPYLNQGRTPPSYNAFERFQLGFHTPTQLTSPNNGMLAPLNSSNQSYLISSSDTHNLNPENPLPAEFFLLENRQKTGWDTYLPGHGMLIYRIVYNKSDWYQNSPNNNSSKMGVDIIEADGIANRNTLSGDPFPGTSGVTAYIPTLRNGTELDDKAITDIRELGNPQIITFLFNGGLDDSGIKVSGDITEFSAEADVPTAPQQITLSGNKLESDIKLTFSDGPYFEIKKANDPDSEWSSSLTLTPVDSILEPTVIQVRYAPESPAFTSLYLNIDVLPKGVDPIALAGKAAPIVNEVAEVDDAGFVANWEPVAHADGYYLTVRELDAAGSELPVIDARWTTSTSDTLTGLQSERDYLYKVRAVQKSSSGNENLTRFSKEIKVRTWRRVDSKTLRINALENGGFQVYIPTSKEEGSKINVFDILGQKIKTIPIPANSKTIDIKDLPKNVVLIIRLDKWSAKVLSK